MNVARPLVYPDEMKIACVPRCVAVECTAASAENAHQLLRMRKRFLRCLPFGHGDQMADGAERSFAISCASNFVGYKQELVILRYRFRDSIALSVVCSERLPELLPCRRIWDDLFKARAQRADGAPCDAVTRFVQAFESRANPTCTRKLIRERDAAIIEGEAARRREPKRPFVLALNGKIGVVEWNEVRADLTLFVFCPHDEEMRDGGVGDPRFGAVQDVLVAVADRTGRHCTRVASCVGFGLAISADDVKGRELRQPFALLLFRAVPIDRHHDERILHREDAPQYGVYRLDLPHDDALHQVVHADEFMSAVVSGKTDTGKPRLFDQVLDHINGDTSFVFIPLGHPR